MPRGHCCLWIPELLWTCATPESVIVLSCFSIPFALRYFARALAQLSDTQQLDELHRKVNELPNGGGLRPRYADLAAGGDEART
jgi:hypothetical protein